MTGKKNKRHVLGEGWTRYQLSDNWDVASKVWLVEHEVNRGFQTPKELKMQKWNKRVRLIVEEI